jgi:hypothetical protein
MAVDMLHICLLEWLDKSLLYLHVRRAKKGPVYLPIGRPMYGPLYMLIRVGIYGSLYLSIITVKKRAPVPVHLNGYIWASVGAH